MNINLIVSFSDMQNKHLLVVHAFVTHFILLCHKLMSSRKTDNGFKLFVDVKY